MKTTSRVCVVGGGFAGVQAVRALRRRAPLARVTLIDRNPYATMIPALPDVLSGRVEQQSIVRPFADIFAADIAAGAVELVTDAVSSVEPLQCTVRGAAAEYAYDYLVLAAGSEPEYYGFQPEEGEQFHTVNTYAGARALREAFVKHWRHHPGGQVLVVGGGYTGLEVAACLALASRRHKAAPRITVVEAADGIVPFLTDRERERIKAYLVSNGIEVRLGTRLQQFSRGTARLSDGTVLENALVCWAAGMRYSGPEFSTPVGAGVETARDGRIITEPTLQLPGHPEVYVAGDAAALQSDGNVVRRAVNFAYYSGRCAGSNVAAAINGRPAASFRPVDLGWVIPLGEMSVGRVLGGLRVGGRIGLRMHYTMSGFRHFGGSNALEFYRTALRLSREPDPLLSQAETAP